MREHELAKELTETAALLARAAEKLTKLTAKLAGDFDRTPPVEPHHYVDTKTAAKMLGMTPGALGALRARRHGPPFIRIGRIIRYPVSRLGEDSGEQIEWKR